MHPSGPAASRQDRSRRWRGLVSGHISEQAVRGKAVVCPGGITLKGPARGTPPSTRGDRGEIAGLSPAARRRLLMRLTRIPLGELVAFAVVLTYHEGYELEPSRWHAQLHTWETKLLRDWSTFGPSLIWMLEFQERGAPHYHVVVCFQREPAIAQLRRWVATSWNAIAEPGDAAHLRAGTRVDRINASTSRGGKKLLAYLAKHAGKSKQKHLRDPLSGEDRPTGKMWDVFGDLPAVVLAEVDVAGDELTQLYRRLRRWGKSSRYLSQLGKRFPGGVIIGAGVDLAQLLRGLVDVAPLAQSASP